ncbi:MAG TPA: ABC transporter permease, partial [Gammaproteobacteria bacterium]|nr:ABC transporter permease [Gammaproteobacteria bacterium]
MTKKTNSNGAVSRFLGVFRYSAVAMRIVWDTSAPLMIAMALTTLIVGLLPAAIASVGGLFVDAVAGALGSSGVTADSAKSEALTFVYIEVGLVLLMTAAQQANTVCQAVLRVLLGNKINVMILEKALTLELAHFEDAEYYDKLVR